MYIISNTPIWVCIMEVLLYDIVINHILNLIFPFDSVLFLTSIHFYNFQEKYLESMGCSDKASKNFIRALMNIYDSKKIKLRQRFFYSFDYNFDIIPFTNNILTARMDKYLESYTIFTSGFFEQKNHIRTKIIMLMAYNSMKTNPNLLTEYRDEFICQLLSHENNEPYRIYLDKYNTCLDVKKYGTEEYDMFKKIICFNVKLVNIFYSMIGIKRAYSLSSENRCYFECVNCGANRDSEQHYNDSCHRKKSYSYKVQAYHFIVTPKTNPGPARYFECPNWYNKIYA